MPSFAAQPDERTPELPAGQPSVVPRPTDWTSLGGTVTLTPRTRVLIDPRARAETSEPSGRAEFPGPAHQNVQQLAAQLRTELGQISGVEPRVASDVAHAGPGDIVLGLADDRELGAEGYRFDSSDGAVRIRAASTHGLFYGTRTLLQLLRSTDGEHRTLPGPAPRTSPRRRSAWSTSTRAASTGRSRTWRT